MTPADTLPATETLRSGLVVTIRHLHEVDRDAIVRAVAGLDRETIYTRLFSYRKGLTEAGLKRIMTVDPAHEVALVATLGTAPAETVIAGCRLIELEGDEPGQGPGRRTAEVAFTVEEDYQGQGIAGRLLGHLIRIARERGYDGLVADVLARNASMLRVFERSGLPMRTRREGESVHLTLDLKAAAR